MSIDRATGVPPLVAGERLSLAEFNRRYEAMPDEKKTELIFGVVYRNGTCEANGDLHMASPVRIWPRITSRFHWVCGMAR